MLVCKPKFHSWGRCTIALTTMHSHLSFNPSSGLCIILYYNTVESGHYLYRCDDCMTGPYHNTGELAKSKMGSGEDRSWLLQMNNDTSEDRTAVSSMVKTESELCVCTHVHAPHTHIRRTAKLSDKTPQTPNIPPLLEFFYFCAKP